MLSHSKTPTLAAVLMPPCAPPYPPRYIIDPVAFFAALVFAPFLVAVLTFWIFLIPVAALFFGGPVYLVVGTPLLLWYLQHHDADPIDLSWLAFKIMAVGLFLGIALGALSSSEDIYGATLFFCGFGMIFGPAWTYGFGRRYRFMRRDFFARPRKF
jgi:hypothetical protein